MESVALRPVALRPVVLRSVVLRSVALLPGWPAESAADLEAGRVRADRRLCRMRRSSESSGHQVLAGRALKIAPSAPAPSSRIPPASRMGIPPVVLK